VRGRTLVDRSTLAAVLMRIITLPFRLVGQLLQAIGRLLTGRR
jgi:hypothetical protein